MKFFVETWYLFAMALVSGAMLAWPTLRRGVPAAGVSCSDAIQLINRERAVVIDVRDAAEFASGHVVNAKNIPLDTLEAATNLPKNKSLPLVVMCPSGARASKAVLILRKLGYDKARTLVGGVKAWREAELPLEKSGA